ncbi:MAG: hypothetical protein JNL70_18690 [Saprospiraceae bacterium]|nr:hypothetical protein [Saprospiraceae bacterium]
MEFLNVVFQSGNDLTDTFKKIAEKLFNEYAIETRYSIYRLVEIEFYWRSEEHDDNSVYRRVHIDPETGTWYFHYSGVDIALKDEVNGGFGGILIRSIYDIQSKKLHKGPQVCAMKLFSGTSVFDNSFKTRLITYKFNETNPLKTIQRKGLGKNAEINDLHKREYNFYLELNKN